MRRWIAFLVLVSAWLFAAAGASMAQTSSLEEEIAFAQRHVEHLRKGEYEEVIAAMDPSVAGNFGRGRLEEIAGHFPRAEPRRIKNSYPQILERPGQPTRYRFLFEHEFQRRLVMTDVILKKRRNGFVIENLHAIHFDRNAPAGEQAEIRAAASHEFSLENRSNTHYVFLAAAILFPLLSIVTAIVAVFTPISLVKKLFWIPFVLVGFGTATLNWSTGQVMLDLWTVNLLSAGYWQEDMGPLMLKIGYPVGVMLFWFLRSGWKADA